MKIILPVLLALLASSIVMADDTKDVNVVNTPTVNANITNPVQVSGTVDVGEVDVSGSVISVDNTVPIPVTDTGAPAIEEIIQLIAGSGGQVCGGSGARFWRVLNGEIFTTFPYSLPSGKKLIVQSISFDISGGPVDQRVLFSIDRGNSINTMFRSRVPTDSNGEGAELYAVNPGIISIVDPCFKYPATGNSRVYIFGYVVDQ